MRGRLLPLLVAALAVLLAGGCTHDRSASASSTGSPSAAPALGGPRQKSEPPPTTPMNRLEQPLAARLARQVRGQGLTLRYLDCPRWDGTVPVRMTCTAYLDGLAAKVKVHLRAAVEGKAVGFDAELARGVIATRRLEATLRSQGATDADCGDTAAYRADAGARIVCRVVKDGKEQYVVATVVDRTGRVMIAAYK